MLTQTMNFGFSMTRGTKQTTKTELAEREFVALLMPLKRKIYNYIQKTLRFSEDAEDVFQEVIIRGYKYFDRYDRKRAFDLWIFAIAHNEIKRYFSGNRFRELTVTDPIDAQPNLPDPEVGQQVREIYRIADELKPKYREVFYLFYYNGFSVREISTICQLKEGNIKFILNGARKRIKEIIGEKNGKK